MSNYAEILGKIRKPLDFARRNDFAALGTLQDVDKTVHGLVEEALAAETDLVRKELLRELRILFIDFDTSPEPEKRRKIEAAIETLGDLESLRSPARTPAPTPPPESEPDSEVTPPAGNKIPTPIPAHAAPQPDFASPLPSGGGQGAGAEHPAVERPIDPGPEFGAGVLPAVVPPQPIAAGAGEGQEQKRSRRGRGGRGRKKEADGGAGTPAAGRSAPPASATASGSGPRLIERNRPAPRTSAAEVAGIRILGAGPPIPGRSIRPNGRRPVVRPGDPVNGIEGETDEAAEEGAEVSNPGFSAPVVRLPERPPDAPPPPRMDDVRLALKRLSEPITSAKGVGPKLAGIFEDMGIATVEDALLDLPRAYQDRSRVTRVADLQPGRVETVLGTVKSRGATRFALRPGFQLIVEDETGEVRAKWFHAHRGMEARFQVGAKVIFAGKFEKYKDSLEVLHPEIEVLDEEDTPESFARITPVYALSEGLGQKTRRKIQAQLVQDVGADFPPASPYWARAKRGLPNPAESLRRVTEPETGDDVQALSERSSLWHKALAYDELFAVQVGLALRKRQAGRDRAPQLKILHHLVAKLSAFLPFPLTDAQERVLAEIKRDLMRNRPMHRLLQGDVGSGKTIVALMAALVAIENRTQVALMAPTEILAEQHFSFVKSTAERIGIRGALITGSMRKADQEEIRRRISKGEVDLVVGTHALIQDGVQFKNLSLVIVDEQHRFGVKQRAALKQKGGHPHVLIMTATPIPRTLALTEFGDLDVSVIDRMPPGRTPVETRVSGEEERSLVYAQIRSDVSSGRQAFVVFPAIEDDPERDVASAVEGQKKLQRDVFPEFRVGLLHGQMSHEEKEGVMTRFKNGAVDILASTTVVEVGVDVPNATVMLVEQAERFGLAQLHQLRGRVGRGAAKSRCFFMLGSEASEEARDRIAVLERTGDGFEIAEADLEFRGPGDLTGIRQAGTPPFRVADPLRDLELMVQAREDAFAMIAADPKMREPEHRAVHEVVKHRWKGRLNLADVG